MSEQDVERMATFGYYADEQCRVMAPDGRIVSMAYSQASAQRFADELNKLSRRAQSPVSGEREREADDKSVETMCSLPSSLTEHVCGSMPAARRIKHYWRVECGCGLETAKCSTEAMAVQVWATANPLRALAPRPAQPNGELSGQDNERPHNLREICACGHSSHAHSQGEFQCRGLTRGNLCPCLKWSAHRPAQTGDDPLVKECLVEHRVDFLSTYVPPQTIAEFKRAATTQFDVALADARFNARKLSAGPAPVAGKAEDDEVQWVVNNLGELGVLVAGRFHFLYKGRSIRYDELERDEDDIPLRWRFVGKREFGETCQPMQLTTLTEVYDQIDGSGGRGWKPLPTEAPAASPLAGKAGETWPRDGEVVEVSIENVARLCRIIDELRAAPVRAEETSEEFIAAADALRRTIGKPWEFNHGHSNLPPSECPVCQCFREFDRTRACMAVKT